LLQDQCRIDSNKCHGGFFESWFENQSLSPPNIFTFDKVRVKGKAKTV